MFFKFFIETKRTKNKESRRLGINASVAADLAKLIPLVYLSNTLANSDIQHQRTQNDDPIDNKAEEEMLQAAGCKSASLMTPQMCASDRRACSAARHGQWSSGTPALATSRLSSRRRLSSGMAGATWLRGATTGGAAKRTKGSPQRCDADARF